MKRTVMIVTSLIIVMTMICGCGLSSGVVGKRSFEGCWEKEDAACRYGALIEGDELVLMFAVGSNKYSRSVSTTLEIVEEEGVFYLYQNGSVCGEIKLVDNNTINITGISAELAGRYKSVNSLDIE